MLEVKDLRTSYGRKEALKGVSLSTQKNAVVSVVGANGAGKSTLLRTIAGLIRPNSGEIWFDRTRIDHLPANQIVRFGISYSPERAPLFPQMSVIDNILVGGYILPSKELARRVELAFQSFPVLQERRKQQARTLSGGERQMLSIARVMIQNPKLIMLDEPSLGLAPLIVQGLAEIILQISAQGVEILMVEQNFWLAHQLSKWLYVLELGKVELEGSPEDLEKTGRIEKAYLG